MPNRAGRSAVKERKPAKPVVDNEENNEVTTTESDTVTTPDFTALIEAAPEDYKPDRAPVGRKRTPSQFEGIFPSLNGRGYQRIPHDGKLEFEPVGETGRKKPTADTLKKSDAHVIIRELRKAAVFLKLGMDLNVTGTHVEFRVRPLQGKREEDEAREASGVDVDIEDDSDEDSDD
jgi:hypothetical protein